MQIPPSHNLTPTSDGVEASLLTRASRRAACVLPAVLAVLLSHAAAVAQPPPAKPQAVGTENAEGAPVEPVVLVEGQITDHIGGGQIGVTVTVTMTAEDGSTKLVGTTTTDDVGDFKVTAPEPIDGDIVVTFAKKGFADLVKEIHLGDDEFPPFLAETLPGALVTIGRVVDALTEKPVAGASITLSAVEQEWFAETDALGEFTIKGVFPGPGDLVVESKGFGREKQHVAHLEEFGEITIALKPERIVHIGVVDDAGKPVSGVTVESYDQPRDDFRTLVTDASGTATLRGVHFDAAMIDLRLTHEDYVSDEAFDRNIVTPEKEVESTHKVVMERAGRIAGVVTHAASKAPLAGARVMTGAFTSDDSPRDWADFQGRFAIHGVRPGKTVVTIHLFGHAPELRTVSVTAGKETTLNVSLGDGNVVRGTVKDEEGKPVSGALVDATKWRGHATLGLRAVSGSDGTFEIHSAPADEFEVVAIAAGASHVTQTVKAGAGEIVLTLSAFAGGGQRSSKVGEKAPTVKMTSLDGKALDITKLRGKTILLDFWATWCGPCIDEIPHLQAVDKKFSKNDNFVMISVSLDDDESALRRFVKKKEMTWHHVVGDAGGARDAADQYGVVGIPALFLIDPEGNFAATNLRGEQLIKEIERVLKDFDPT